jgi:hypothetical protein
MPLPRWRRISRILDNRVGIAYRVACEIREALRGMWSNTTLFYFDGGLSVHSCHEYDTAYVYIKFPPGAFPYSASVIFSNDGRFHAQFK